MFLHDTLEAILILNKKCMDNFNYLPNCCPLALVRNTAHTFELSRLLCSSHQVGECSEEINCQTNFEMWSASNRRKGWFLTKFENRRNSDGAVGRCGKFVMYLISRALISKLLVSCPLTNRWETMKVVSSTLQIWAVTGL